MAKEPNTTRPSIRKIDDPVDFTRRVLEEIVQKTPHETEYHQAIREVFQSLAPLLRIEPKYREHAILQRLAEPERQIIFRVVWQDDRRRDRVNRGYRIQHNSAIGPYKGGLRFHPSVNQSILKFLAFEQTFKNSLTGLPIGGGKGGSDFDPKGLSDGEIMRFCQSFADEIYRHIGADRDVPAGDIGVSGREIGFLFGQYKRIVGDFVGAFTGKGIGWGGSLIRPEATGYGCVYFAEEMMVARGESLRGKVCTISGSGNVAVFAAEKLFAIGAKPITLSDSGGTIHDPDGLDAEKIDYVKNLKFVRKGRIAEYVERFPRASHHAGRFPWFIPAECAFPCATQNEIGAAAADAMIANGYRLISEGANMPSDPAAVDRFLTARVLFGPGKAANAGGVAVSGLEMAQNSTRSAWTREEVDRKLREIMKNIHEKCFETAKRYGHEGNYVVGANISSFIKVADAMLDQGLV